MKSLSRLLIVVLYSCAVSGLLASEGISDFNWQLIRPSGTGIPGDRVMFAELDPAGRLWVGARDAVAAEGGVAVFDGRRWITFTHLNSPLPSPDVYAAAFDPRGAVWLGTGAGLVRFDGATWTAYGAHNAPLPAGVVTRVRLDHAHHVWLLCRGAAGSSVALFDGEEWSVWSARELGFAAATRLSGLAFDAQGYVWVGSDPAGGLARYDWQEWTVLDADEGFSAAAAGCLTLGTDNRLWLDWNGLKRYDGQRWDCLPGLPGAPRYTAVAVESADCFWTGTDDGRLARYGDGWRIWNTGEPVLSVAVDARGQAWSAGPQAVHCLTNQGSLQSLSAATTGLAGGQIHDFSFDRSGRLWVATATGGLCLFDGTRWQSLNSRNHSARSWPFHTDDVRDVLAARDGSVWIALKDQGVARLMAGSWTHFLEYQRVRCLTEDAHGRIWISFFGGAALYEGGGKFKCFGTAEGLPAAAVRCLAGDAAGNVWAGTDAGLHGYDGRAWQSYTMGNSALTADRVTSLAVQEGALWIGTAAGLARFDGASWERFDEVNSALPARAVTGLACTPEGELWTSVDSGSLWQGASGVAHFDGAQWMSSQFPGEANCIAVGPRGNVWVGTAGVGIALLGTGDEAPRATTVDLLAAFQNRVLEFPWDGSVGLALREPCDGEIESETFAGRWTAPAYPLADPPFCAVLTAY